MAGARKTREEYTPTIVIRDELASFALQVVDAPLGDVPVLIQVREGTSEEVLLATLSVVRGGLVTSSIVPRTRADLEDRHPVGSKCRLDDGPPTRPKPPTPKAARASVAASDDPELTIVEPGAA